MTTNVVATATTAVARGIKSVYQHPLCRPADIMMESPRKTAGRGKCTGGHTVSFIPVFHQLAACQHTLAVMSLVPGYNAVSAIVSGGQCSVSLLFQLRMNPAPDSISLQINLKRKSRWNPAFGRGIRGGAGLESRIWQGIRGGQVWNPAFGREFGVGSIGPMESGIWVWNPAFEDGIRHWRMEFSIGPMESGFWVWNPAFEDGIRHLAHGIPHLEGIRGRRAWNSAFGIPHLERIWCSRVWNSAFGLWNPAFVYGIWHLAYGILHSRMEFGIWPMESRIRAWNLAFGARNPRFEHGIRYLAYGIQHLLMEFSIWRMEFRTCEWNLAFWKEFRVGGYGIRHLTGEFKILESIGGRNSAFGYAIPHLGMEFGILKRIRARRVWTLAFGYGIPHLAMQLGIWHMESRIWGWNSAFWKEFMAGGYGIRHLAAEFGIFGPNLGAILFKVGHKKNRIPMFNVTAIDLDAMEFQDSIRRGLWHSTATFFGTGHKTDLRFAPASKQHQEINSLGRETSRAL
ncbi:hypothetical protein K438DRAFT_1764288 [Mycena galopus ATCC 62051]|nr:hypothetical protein K438DRAFT_1764288 [Mycena galopus ATCC 62051]